MREIKFRGKRIDNGEWVIGKNVMFAFDNKRAFITPSGNSVAPLKPMGILSMAEEVRVETIGQYIGLEDRDGVEVYEGDKIDNSGVVAYGDMNCNCCSGVYGWCVDNGDIRYIDSSKVTGSIHDEVTND